MDGAGPEFAVFQSRDVGGERSGRGVDRSRRWLGLKVLGTLRIWGAYRGTLHVILGRVLYTPRDIAYSRSNESTNG